MLFNCAEHCTLICAPGPFFITAIYFTQKMQKKSISKRENIPSRLAFKSHCGNINAVRCIQCVHHYVHLINVCVHPALQWSSAFDCEYQECALP